MKKIILCLLINSLAISLSKPLIAQKTAVAAVEKITEPQPQAVPEEPAIEQQEGKPSMWLSWFGSLRRPTWHDTQAVKAYVYRKYRCLRSGEGCSRKERKILATLAAAVGIIIAGVVKSKVVKPFRRWKEKRKQEEWQKARQSKVPTKEERESELVYRYRTADPDNRSFILRDIGRENINALDSDGETALMIAAALGRINDVKTLLSVKNIAVNHMGKYGTALSNALSGNAPTGSKLYENKRQIAKQLIKAGAEILPWMHSVIGWTELIEEIKEELAEEKQSPL